MSETIISDQKDSVAFIQIWTVGSPDHQARWLEVMHHTVGILTSQPGFISISHHVSLNGSQIAVYAQWESEQMATAAVSLHDAKQAHEEMTRWGTSDGTFYRVASVLLRDASASQ